MSRLDYSVVIPIGQITESIKSLESLTRLPAAERPKKILVCVGKNPSLQRNLGLELCKSPLVYFLDEDSWVIPGTPTRLAAQFEGERTAAAGGPNLPYPDATPFEKTASSILASWMGSFKVRNRYASIGSIKEATEKDLILCNLMVRREIFQELRGFRPNLYPNEENEFLNRLLHSGYQLIYDPAAAVYRPRRKNVWEFCYQAFRYGQGRARQMKVYPCLSDLVHLVPAFFVFYVLSLGFSLSPFPAPFLHSWLWWTPLELFAALCLGTAVAALSWHRNPADLAAVPFLIFFRQFFYGVGLMAGLVLPTPLKNAAGVESYEVEIGRGTYRLRPAARARKKKK